MSLIALRNFRGPDGRYRVGDVIEPKNDERASFLIDGGFAKKATKAEERAAAAAATEGASSSAAPSAGKAPKATAGKAA